MSFKKRYPTFDAWWQEVALHAAARYGEMHFDKELWRDDYRKEIDPWEAVVN